MNRGPTWREYSRVTSICPGPFEHSIWFSCARPPSSIRTPTACTKHARIASLEVSGCPFAVGQHRPCRRQRVECRQESGAREACTRSLEPVLVPKTLGVIEDTSRAAGPLPDAWILRARASLDELLQSCSPAGRSRRTNLVANETVEA